MNQLIEITSVPIEIRMKTTNASLEYTRGTAEMEISRSDKGVDIKSRPIRVQLDTFEQRSRDTAANAGRSVPQPQQTAPVTQPPQVDRPVAAYEATAAYSDQGQIMLNARFGQEFLEQSAPAAAPAPENTVQENVAADTEKASELEDGQMEIRYEMDKLNFDWKIDKGEFKFTPGDIEISVEQQPEIIIKYTGGPIYVPRSADPNYEPVDVKA